MTPEEIHKMLIAESPAIQWRHVPPDDAKKRKGANKDTIYFDGVYRGGVFPVGFKPGIDRRTIQKVAKAAEEGFKKANRMGEL